MESNTITNNSVTISQRVAILVDGNNIGMALHEKVKDRGAMLNFKTMVPKLLMGRGLNRLYYFREGHNISPKLAQLLHEEFFGVVVPCGKSADMQLVITATEIADKVDTIILLSGDVDYLPLVKHLHSRGVRVEVSCVKASASEMLIREADSFTEITSENCWMFQPKKNGIKK